MSLQFPAGPARLRHHPLDVLSERRAAGAFLAHFRIRGRDALVVCLQVALDVPKVVQKGFAIPSSVSRPIADQPLHDDRNAVLSKPTDGAFELLSTEVSCIDSENIAALNTKVSPALR